MLVCFSPATMVSYRSRPDPDIVHMLFARWILEAQSLDVENVQRQLGNFASHGGDRADRYVTRSTALMGRSRDSIHNLAERQPRRQVLVSGASREGLSAFHARSEAVLRSARLTIRPRPSRADGAGVCWLHRLHR